MVVYVLFFCFKQNTAYEMRISDWSSDVCSSDLEAFPRKNKKGPADRRPMVPSHGPRAVHETQTSEHVLEHCIDGVAIGQQVARPEAHTSELQSLMRISFAVFGLTNKEEAVWTAHATDSYCDLIRTVLAAQKN